MASDVPLPIDSEADPRKPTLEEAVDRIEEEVTLTAGEKLSRLASAVGNLAEAMDEAELAKLGAECVDDYEQDKKDRETWEKVARDALEAAAQSKAPADKNWPWPGASNIKFPILTEAALQFNARMYPAVVKGDEAVLCKVIGQDNGRPKMAPHPNRPGEMGPVPMMQPNPEDPNGPPVPVMTPDGQIVPMWEVEPGAKAKRARRVSEYLNTTIFYRMDDWEVDTDALLMQLPVVGSVFRKQWWDADLGLPCSGLVPALRLYVPKGTKSCKTAERITEEIPDVTYRTILSRIRSSRYLDLATEIAPGEEEQKSCRLLLEQHRYIDLDEDGMGEPYIVTIDHGTRKVLRIEPNFGPDDIMTNRDGKVIDIVKGEFYTHYPMFPDPEGGFYGLGLGHLLKQLGAVIDTAINQLLDAGTAQTAGGGFIGSGVRLQGGKSGVVRMMPGEYKTVPISGTALREAIVERTLPNVSPVTFQVLDLIMGMAQSIAGAKDVLTGEAANTGQVGTTLALIEQGLQVFNATAKRVFRSFKAEYTLLRDNVGRYGDETTAQDYIEVLDDPEANFAADFASEDMDIRPVSDPSAITKMQKMAKAQFVMGTMPQLAAVGGDPREALKRAYEAADVEDIDKLLPPPKPQMPNPKDMADVKETMAKANKAQSEADLNNIEVARGTIAGQVEELHAGLTAAAAGEAVANAA